MPKKLRKVTSLVSTQRLDESVTSKKNTVEIVKELWPEFLKSRERALSLEHWYRDNFDQLGVGEMPHLPDTAGADLRELRESSATPWAKMIADAMSQNLIIDGLRQKDTGDDAPALTLWQRNGLDSRQRAVHDAVIRHGKAFNLVGRAIGRLDNAPTAFIRGKSAINFDAWYRDDYDEWPEFALEGRLQQNIDGTADWRIDFYDESRHHRLSFPNGEEDKMKYIDYERHDMGVTPVVRAAGNLDLTGATIGEVEPYIRLFKRINQSTMDRLTVQRYGAFVVRWIAGIAEPPGTDAEKRAAAIALAVTDLLVSPSTETKFGSLPPTPLDGYIRSREADVRDLGAVSQTPLFHMLGLSDNVGADGLAAAEAAHFRKVDGWKINLGEFWESSMRLGGHAAGEASIANDFESRAHWKDTRAMSFQSFAQGLSTLATGLGIPGEALWGWVPGWEQPDTEMAKKLRDALEAKQLAEAALLAAAGGNTGTGVSGGGRPAAGGR